MSEQSEKVIVASMAPRKMSEWKAEKKQRRFSKRSLAYLCAAILCLSAGTYALIQDGEQSESVMSHMTTGFEYDETIGRLQYVSSILPESAMVFLSSTEAENDFTQPTQAEVLHAWTQEEPWIEYSCSGSVLASAGGDVMTIVQSRNGEYTVRLLHEGGYESIYSGLTDVTIGENDSIAAGAIIGSASGQAAFELRKDGMSVLPVFAEVGDTE